MESVLVIGQEAIAKRLTKQLKTEGVRSYTISRQGYFDPNTMIIQKDIFALKSSDLPPVRIVYYFPKPEKNTVPDYKKAYYHALNHLLKILPKNVKVIYGSSGKVYGDQLGVWVNEHSPLNLYCPRSKAIRNAEILLEKSDRLYTILRLGQLYQDTDELTSRIKKGKVSYSQRQQMMNHLHIDDLIEAALTLIPHNGTYIVSDSTPTAFNTILSLLSSRLGAKVKHPRSWMPRRKGVRLSPSKLLTLGYSFEYPAYVSC